MGDSLDLSKLMELKLKESELWIDSAKALHGDLNSIAESGRAVEDYFISLLRRILPSRFSVTTGYILNPSKEERMPQVDIIVYDNTYAPFHSFPDERTSVVAWNSVCAVFEVNKKLNLNTIKSSQEHLSKIIERSGITRKDTSNMLPGCIKVEGGRISTAHRSNPMIGILSFEADSNMCERIKDRIDDKIDIVWALDQFIGLRYCECGECSSIQQDNDRSKKTIFKCDFTDDSAKGFSIATGAISQYMWACVGKAPVGDGNYYNEFFYDIDFKKENK